MDQDSRGFNMGSSEPWSVPERVWEVASSVYGRGTTLNGQVDDCVFLVLAPPAVPLPTPPDWPAPLASSGWRAAWLMLQADGLVVLDEQEPFSLEPLSLSEAVGLVLDHCPQFLPWVADQVKMRMGTTAFTLKPDCDGNVPAGAGHREAALISMLADAEAAVLEHSYRLASGGRCPLDQKWLSDLRAIAAPVLDSEFVFGGD